MRRWCLQKKAIALCCRFFYRKFTTSFSFFNYILLFTRFSTLRKLVSKIPKLSMKKTVLKYVLLLVSFGLLSTRIFAQVPLDPGNDPMQPDSAKFIIPVKRNESNNSTFCPNFSLLKKDKHIPNKKSENTLLSKNGKEDDSHMIF